MDSVVMYQGNTELHSISTYFDPEGNYVSIIIHQDLGLYISFYGRKGFVLSPNIGIYDITGIIDFTISDGIY